MHLQEPDDSSSVAFKIRLQLFQSHIAHFYKNKFFGPSGSNIGMIKVRILSNKNSIFKNRNFIDHSISGKIPFG